MADPIDTRDIVVIGDPTRARDTVAAALSARGFKLTWTDAWNGTATKGSRGKQMIFGAFATYFEVRLSLIAGAGGTTVRIARPSTGISGGLAGRARAKNQFESLIGEVTTYFQANGVLQQPPQPQAGV